MDNNLLNYTLSRLSTMSILSLVRFVVLTLARWAERKKEPYLERCGYHKAMKLLLAFDACEKNHPFFGAKTILDEMGAALNEAQESLPPLCSEVVNTNPIPFVLPFAQAFYLYYIGNSQRDFDLKHHSIRLPVALALQIALHCRNLGGDYYQITGKEDAQDRALIDAFVEAQSLL